MPDHDKAKRDSVRSIDNGCTLRTLRTDDSPLVALLFNVLITLSEDLRRRAACSQFTMDCLLSLKTVTQDQRSAAIPSRED
jgi:hypothetical protein